MSELKRLRAPYKHRSHKKPQSYTTGNFAAAQIEVGDYNRQVTK